MSEDPCVFKRGHGDDKAWVCLLVDDMMMAGRTAALDKFSEKLRRDFKVKTQAGDRLSYIGLDIRTTDNGDRIVAQGGCRQRILERFHDLLRTSKKNVKSLANTEAFRLDAERDTRPLDQRRRKVYLSGVMSCMFLSRLTRYDMLFWNTYLSTKCSKPAECDMEDLVRMLKYLECSGNWGSGTEPKSRQSSEYTAIQATLSILTEGGTWEY